MQKEIEPTYIPRNAGGSETGPEAPSTYLRLVYSPELEQGAPDVGRFEVLGEQPKQTLHFGRAPETHESGRAWPLLYDNWISRNHAQAFLKNDQIILRDLGSRNGTFLDGQRITGEVSAQPGQIFRVGRTIFVIGQAPLDRAAEIQRQHAVPSSIDAWSWCMIEAWGEVAPIARSECSILLLGETGTGKTQLAKQLHLVSHRFEGPFTSHNCAAIPATLEESTLFGVIGGSATGVNQKKGLLQLAEKGTLFLDELSELSLSAQGKLLDAFDTTDPSYLPVGGTKRLKTSCRLISATNRSIQSLVKENTMRADLVSRLAADQVTVPPLRQRREDLLAIFYKFLGTEYLAENKAPVPSAEVAEAMLLAGWPENVRGLGSLAAKVKAGRALSTELVRRHGERGAFISDDGEAFAPEQTGSFPVEAKPETATQSREWPTPPKELLTLLTANDWSIAEVGRIIGRRRETVSRLLTTTFGKGGKTAAKRAFRIWKASGRIPNAEQLVQVHAAYDDEATTPDMAQLRADWEAGKPIAKSGVSNEE
jgi:DNA-binding NtrC family response regulator